MLGLNGLEAGGTKVMPSQMRVVSVESHPTGQDGKNTCDEQRDSKIHLLRFGFITPSCKAKCGNFRHRTGSFQSCFIHAKQKNQSSFAFQCQDFKMIENFRRYFKVYFKHATPISANHSGFATPLARFTRPGPLSLGSWLQCSLTMPVSFT